jgi:ubiquinone/menaquinone biosynthesis C-methylase UbiE
MALDDPKLAASLRACDLSRAQIAPQPNSMITFKAASAYELPYANDEFELLVCCEVHEHLERPADAVRELERVASKAVLLSTPREPCGAPSTSRAGSISRRYAILLGHVQHFSRRTLSSLVA